MKMTISETAAITGVSVRTLHYYDEIGLLKPPYVDEQNGYRFYNESSLERLQEILFFRELDFSLKAIAEILSSPDYDKKKALAEQKNLLLLKKSRLERIIAALDSAEKGENTMNFNVFDNTEYEAAQKQYAEEAKQKWGKTDAYKESAEKTSSYSKEKWGEVYSDMDDIMAEFAECMNSGFAPSDEQAQLLVKKWQDFITKSMYDCTKEILAGLGQMYVCDERFTANIDKHGAGTAAFMSEAITKYCE